MTVMTWSSPSPKQRSFSHCLSSTRKEGNGRYFEEITEALGVGGGEGGRGVKGKKKGRTQGREGQRRGRRVGGKDRGMTRREGGRQQL